MKTTLVITAAAAILAAQPKAVRGIVVSDPLVEEATLQKNLFDQLKYAWEQTQWADKLATLHNTLTTVREQLETANQVKQAIGDPVAATARIDNGLFSNFLQNSGIGDTLSELANITQKGAELSTVIHQLFAPIDTSAWTNLSADFEGIASFRDSSDPLKRFRAINNAYSRFEILIGRVQNKRKVLNHQIARLNTQLKGAENDAEVQKLAGSLATAQTALDALDSVSESVGRGFQMLHTLNQNRRDEEEVAAEEISRQRNRKTAKLAAEAEAALPDLNTSNPNLPPGF